VFLFASLIAELSERITTGNLTVRGVSGEALSLSAEEVAMAVLASKCVASPKLGELQWLSTLETSDLLGRLFVRILVCNRDIPDFDAIDDTVAPSAE